MSHATRVRIYSHVTRSRFLHIEDALSIDKLRLFAGIYQRGQGMTDYVQHYMDSADARVILTALTQERVGFTQRMYKGTPPHKQQGAISRVLSVSIKEDKAYIELKSGPGKVLPTGAIKPAGAATAAVNIVLSLYEAQRLALTTLAYLQAFDVLRMQQLHYSVSVPPPYLQVSTSAPTIVVDGQAKIGKSVKQSMANENEAPLRYVDGTDVSAENPTEQETFSHYQQTTGKLPANKAALQSYYRQQAATA